MKLHILNELQRKLKPKSFVIIDDQIILNFLFDETKVEKCIISSDCIYIFSSFKLYSNFFHVLPLKFFIETIEKIVLNDSIIYIDTNYCSVDTFLKIKNKYKVLLFNLYPYIYDISLNEYMIINTIKIKKFFPLFLSYLRTNMQFEDAKKFFKILCTSYEIDDNFIFISSIEKNQKKLFLKNKCYSIDFGIKSCGVWCDLCIIVKFGKLNYLERKFIDLLNKMQYELIDFLDKYNHKSVSFNSIFKKFETNNIYFENGIGHHIGLNVHCDPFLSRDKKVQLIDNYFFTLEPIVNFKNSNKHIQFRIEKTYGFFNDKIISYFDFLNSFKELSQYE